MTATNELIGTLSESGDRHRGQFGCPSNPERITVRTSAGGAATADVTLRGQR